MPDPTHTPRSFLVVDDEQGIRDLLWQWLHRAGHEVICVASGQEAARAAQNRHFDVLITDIVMPEGDGFELIGEFRRHAPTARIVAISGGGMYLQRDACLHIASGLGAHAVVMKPFNWEQLRSGIDAALGSAAPAE